MTSDRHLACGGALALLWLVAASTHAAESGSSIWFDIVNLPEGVRAGENCPVDSDVAKATNAAAAKAEQSALIPLKVGLTLADIWTREENDGDHECLMQVVGVADAYVDITFSCEVGKKKVAFSRRICRTDMRMGEFFHPAFVRNGPSVMTPVTAFTLSSHSLHELNARGKTHFHWFELNEDPRTRPTPLAADEDTTLHTVPASSKTYRMIVNDRVVDLPVIRVTSAKADDEEDDGGNPFDLRQLESFALGGPAPGDNDIQAVVLNDERFPIVLDYNVPGRNYRLRYYKISYAAPGEMEKKLAVDKRVDVYGIYFDFASDKLRPESGAVLEEIAGVLQKNADWKLSITGHTDNIGGDAPNLELSKKRAAAVKAALVERYHISDGRLTTGGMGASQPQDRNDTAEGRARNRRVELRRQDSK
jgi:outer membrane protein OmpA-like peptidoglycan-associated protein